MNLSTFYFILSCQDLGFKFVFTHFSIKLICSSAHSHYVHVYLAYSIKATHFLSPVIVTTTPLEGCSSWINKCASYCVDGEGTIPRTVFFVKVDDEFIFREWLSVMSAVNIIKADTITVFSAKPMDPESCWWKRTLPFIKHEIVPERRWVTELNGKVVKELAHKSDFLRVEALYRLGGIYMDTDAIALKSFEPLLNNHNVVLAKQPVDLQPAVLC